MKASGAGLNGRCRCWKISNGQSGWVDLGGGMERILKGDIWWADLNPVRGQEQRLTTVQCNQCPKSAYIRSGLNSAL